MRRAAVCKGSDWPIMGEQVMDKARIKYRKQEWEIDSGMTVRAAIEKIGLDPGGVLALREKRLINDQTIIQPDDEIRLVNVISGG
jgi:sulfur carrier protein ThiS